MPWRALIGQRGEPISCPRCGRVLAEVVDGVVVQRHGRISLGAILVACDRPGCDGAWRSESDAARLAFERMGRRPPARPAAEPEPPV